MALLRSRLAELDALLASPTFWESERFNPDIPKERSEVQKNIEDFESLASDLSDADEFLSWKDAEVFPDVRDLLTRAHSQLSELESQLLFPDTDHEADALVSIQAGAGGIESQYWVSVLLRAYSRWADARGWSVELVDWTPGSEEGMQSVTLTVEGQKAFGYLRTETGTHRFCRISPYDSSGRVHTSFVAVDVIPNSSDSKSEIVLNDSDLEEEVFRSSGPGGQHANKVSTAVRLRHIPSGIVVACQAGRSQHLNREQARAMLVARLERLEQEELEREMSERWENKAASGFGNRIRSYELHQGQYIKDHRSDFVTYRTDEVLGGDFDEIAHSVLTSLVSQD